MFKKGEIVIKDKVIYDHIEKENFKCEENIGFVLYDCNSPDHYKTMIERLCEDIKRNIRVMWSDGSTTYEYESDLEKIDSNEYKNNYFIARKFSYSNYIKWINLKYGGEESKISYIGYKDIRLYKVHNYEIIDNKIIDKNDTTELTKVRNSNLNRFMLYKRELLDCVYGPKYYFYIVDFEENNIYSVNIDYVNIKDKYKDTKIFYKEKILYIKEIVLDELNKGNYKEI